MVTTTLNINKFVEKHFDALWVMHGELIIIDVLKILGFNSFIHTQQQ